MERQLFLVAYDVSDPKRLARALQAVKRFASGGQKSVFECWVDAPERRALLAGARRVLHPGVDRFLLVRLDPRQPSRLLGLAEPVADPDFLYHG